MYIPSFLNSIGAQIYTAPPPMQVPDYNKDHKRM